MKGFNYDKIIHTFGGIVGRVENGNNGIKRIGIQFKYQIAWDRQTETTPIYTLDPWAARYAGWHLLRRGIADGIKESARNFITRRKRHVLHKTD